MVARYRAGALKNYRETGLMPARRILRKFHIDDHDPVDKNWHRAQRIVSDITGQNEFGSPIDATSMSFDN